MRGRHRGVVAGVDRGHVELGHAQGIRQPIAVVGRRHVRNPAGQHGRVELRQTHAERSARVNPILQK